MVKSNDDGTLGGDLLVDGSRVSVLDGDCAHRVYPTHRRCPTTKRNHLGKRDNARLFQYFLDMTELTLHERARGATLGALIGDALSMPAHWYYDTEALRLQFGRITDFVDPPAEHPGSILWRSSYEPTEPEYDILGEQRNLWGRRGVHYHRFLRAGENTLNAKLLQLALKLVATDAGYDRGRYLVEYQRFMLAPNEHRDTYVEECHRGFFLNLRRGVPAARCGIKEKHIGGMVAVLPLYAALRGLGRGHAEATAAVQDHVSVTHAGALVSGAAATLLVIAGELWDGEGLTQTLSRHLKRQDLPYLQGPIELLAQKSVDQVLGRHFSSACYLDGAMPATFYLALKYANDPVEGLIENTMAGGDNCGRGAVLGALYGLSLGPSAFPEPWCAGLAATSGEQLDP